MKDEYISRAAASAYAPLPKGLREYQTENLDDAFEDGYDFAIKQIEAIPAADVAPVVRGEWIDKPSGPYGRWQSWFSACGKHSGIGGIESNWHKPYCPNCGADMRTRDKS